ncbi:MAG: thioredoxin domain-containing protein [Candidatus Micrarchaeaceae archaeon]
MAKQSISRGHVLTEFYGKECPHCHAMDSLVDRLAKEEKVTVKRLEVWHNHKNAKTMQSVGKGRCGGVPFFFNAKTSKSICGETGYAALKKWALEK